MDNKFYITVRQPPKYHQMTFEEFLYSPDANSYLISQNETNTKTYEVSYVSKTFMERVDITYLVDVLRRFNEQTEDLRRVERKTLYKEFFIPKKSGGLRKIDAPNNELMCALRRLKTIFEKDFGALYHTSAFAYIPKRSVVDCMKRHQANESKWFAKYDLSNFFGSTTLDFVMKMFGMVFPFSEIVQSDLWRAELEKAVELAFFNGGLPQGTPVSPCITNIMMIPVDFKLSKMCRSHDEGKLIYTRYADDFQISSRCGFDYKSVESEISNVLNEYGASFKINESKTRYGSSAGRNWNLGLMLNKDNKITVGHKKKERFRAMLSSFALDTIHGTQWSLEDVQRLDGIRNYYKMVEGDVIDGIVKHVGKKYNMNIIAEIRKQLKG